MRERHGLAHGDPDARRRPAAVLVEGLRDDDATGDVDRDVRGVPLPVPARLGLLRVLPEKLLADLDTLPARRRVDGVDRSHRIRTHARGRRRERDAYRAEEGLARADGVVGLAALVVVRAR